MLNKIFFVLLLIAVLAMSFFTIYSYTWLSSVGDPAITAENFQFYSDLGWNFLWISTVALVVFAAVAIWKTGQSIAIWLTYAYFAAFMIMQTFWLAGAFQAFKQTNSLAENSISFTPMLGIISIVILAVIVFFTRFIAQKIHNKMFAEDSTEVDV